MDSDACYPRLCCRKGVGYWRGWLLARAAEWAKKVYFLIWDVKREPWKWKQADLEGFPEESLGYQLGRFLQENGFQLMDYYEKHDVYHVLTGYAPEVIEEAQMQFFLLGNGKRSPSVWVTCLVALILLPEYAATFWKDYLKGRDCHPIGRWKFEFLLGEPLWRLRAIMNRDKMEETENLIY
jgi:hypothetical protein